jgi:putative membrane protein
MLTVPLAASTDTAAILQLVPLAILAVLYARRARSLAEGAQPLPRWRQICFYGGLASVAIALSTLARIGKELLFMHTLGDLLFGEIAAALIVLGLTAPLLAPLLRVPAVDRLRVLAHPLAAFALWAVDLYLWHLPVLYQAALRHPGVQALQHVMLLVLAINMWMCLLGPFASPRWFGDTAKLIYILAVGVALAVLSNIILWSGTAFYPYYLKGDAHFHISPVADQSIGGAIMLLAASIGTLCLFCWLFRQVTREQAPLDASRARGLALGEMRAGRALARGRDPEPRERLEARSGAPERM